MTCIQYISRIYVELYVMPRVTWLFHSLAARRNVGASTTTARRPCLRPSCSRSTGCYRVVSREQMTEDDTGKQSVEWERGYSSGDDGQTDMHSLQVLRVDAEV